MAFLLFSPYCTCRLGSCRFCWASILEEFMDFVEDFGLKCNKYNK